MSNGTSVLASLTAEVMAEKTKEKAKLTPLAGEKVPFPLEQARIPNDTGKFLSNEALWEHARQLRKFAADAIVIADGLDALLNESSKPDEKQDKVEARKADEAVADAKAAEREAEETPLIAMDAEFPTPLIDFDREFKTKQKAAQEETFGWVCPTHGKPGAEKTSPNTGRTFIGCPECNLFKR